ncbi:malic oxidoreductase [Kipferlia bialata]|uniref:Malic oxidoreductase n=1 Tax=Kipferlia bialata TaxID=797122 RepID=A0A9K3CZK6_9EUKA|nr:malic oxidoreductase [Kipferlia bialata]|eukprot:g7131.t1
MAPAICVGKLSLYTLGGGFAPEHTLPISFDFGCDKPEIRSSPYYLGLKEERNKGEDFCNLINETIKAVRNKWPRCVFQFEDFSNDTAFRLLDRHRADGPIFNDDIQGTGCIAAAVVASAIRAQSIRRGHTIKASDQTWVMLGAGAGGIGVAERIAVLIEDEGCVA